MEPDDAVLRIHDGQLVNLVGPHQLEDHFSPDFRGGDHGAPEHDVIRPLLQAQAA